MKAVADTRWLPVTDRACLLDLDLPEPTPGERDLRVLVSVVSVDPVDTKVRRAVAPAAGQPRVLADV